jgi:hypothetical protein
MPVVVFWTIIYNHIKGTKVMYSTNHGFHYCDGLCVNLKLCCGYKCEQECAESKKEP